MRADHVGGVARRLDIGPVLRCDLLAVVAHHGCEFDHLLAQLFGGSLCNNSGHSSSTSSRISSETSERPSVSDRNLCSGSKSSCIMMCRRQSAARTCAS